MTDGVELARYIESLREELVTAWMAGRDSPVGFEVGSVELEVSINAERTAEVKGGVRFWVLDAGLGGERHDAVGSEGEVVACPQRPN